MRGKGALAIGILAFQLAATALASEDLAADYLAAEDLASGVRNLLAAGSKPSAEALDVARAQYDGLCKLPGFDPRAKYAFALVLIEQRQLTEASKLLDEILAEKPQMLPVWQTKIWAALAARDYPAALSAMRAAASQLEKLDADPGRAVTDERKAIAGLMGRGIGFLAAAAKTGITAEQLKAGREEILAKLGTDRAAFLISQQMMASEIAALDYAIQNAGQARDTAAAKRQARQSEKTREVGKQADQNDFAILKNKTDSAAQLRSTDAALSEFRSQLAKAQFDLKALELAINAQLGHEQLQQLELDNTQLSPATATDLINGEQNMGRIVNNVKQLIARRNLLLGQIVDLDQKLKAAVLQRNRLVVEEEMTAAELQTNADRLKQAEKKLEYAEKHPPQTARASRAGAALRERRKSFSNLEPLAFAREKERAVGWFEK